jgi:hypothetical protein
MDTFTLVKAALAKSENDTDREGLDPRTREIGRVTAAVQTVVDALTPPDGGRYIVGFVDMTTAATDLQARRIIVSSKPLEDRRLTLVEKAVVVATFAAHEIGHTIVTRPRGTKVQDHNPKSGYHAVANLADDIILEPFMVDRYPILADAFEFTGQWVLRTTAKSLPKVETGRWDSTPARFNTLISATRYGDTTDIVWQNRKALDERTWGRDWAARLIALRLNDHDGFLALCDEAWDRIRTKDEPIEEPPPPICDGPTGPGGDKPERGDDEPKGDKPKPEQGDEPGDEQGEDEGPGGSDDEPGEDGDEQGDEPGDDATDGEDGDDATDGGDEPTDESGDDGESGDEGGDEPPTDWGDEPGEQGDEPGEDGEPEDGEDGDPGDGSDEEYGDGDPGRDANGGGGNADASADDLRDEDEWNDDDVDQTTHTEAHQQHWDYSDERAEDAVRTYQNTGTTTFGRHGKMTTTWT